MILIVIGLMLATSGWILLPWIPSIKRMMSLSFTLRALGYCFLLMSLSYWIVDVLKWRRGIGVFLLYGKFSLAAYVFHSMFYRPLQTAAGHLTQGLSFWVGASSRELWMYIGVAFLQTWFMLIWSRSRKE